MQAADIRVAIESQIDSHVANAVGPIDFSTLLAIASRVIHSFDLSAIPVDEIVTAIEGLFDQYILPVDIPYVPNFLEPAIKAGLRKQIRPFVEHIVDELKKPNGAMPA